MLTMGRFRLSRLPPIHGDHHVGEKAIADAEESISTLSSEIAALQEGIKKLDELTIINSHIPTEQYSHEQHMQKWSSNRAQGPSWHWAKPEFCVCLLFCLANCLSGHDVCLGPSLVHTHFWFHWAH